MTALEPGLTRSEALRAPLAVGTLGLGAFALLHLRDPHSDGSYGFCPFLEVTGKPCPGCGGLRAVNDLTRGDVVGAISSNVLVVALVAVLGVAWVLWMWRRLHGRVDRMIVLTPLWTVVVLSSIVVFAVVRNLPPGAWLAP